MLVFGRILRNTKSTKRRVCNKKKFRRHNILLQFTSNIEIKPRLVFFFLHVKKHYIGRRQQMRGRNKVGFGKQ